MCLKRHASVTGRFFGGKTAIEAFFLYNRTGNVLHYLKWKGQMMVESFIYKDFFMCTLKNLCLKGYGLFLCVYESHTHKKNVIFNQNLRLDKSVCENTYSRVFHSF